MTRPARLETVRSMRLACRVLAAALGVMLVAGLAGCARGSDAAQGSDTAQGTEGAEGMMGEVRMHDETVPGPAAGMNGMPILPGSAAVPVRVYEPSADDDGAPWGTLVWAHGGSFLRGTLDWPEADWVARRFAEAGLRVYSVDYALASETVKAPAPANDVAAVLREALQRHAGPVFVGGASAGGHLAAAAALSCAEVREDPPRTPARSADALALVYPTLHRVQRPDAAIAALTADLPEARRFDPARIAEMYDFYLGEAAASDPADSVQIVGELPAERLAALPPTIIVNAEADDLRASAEQFAEQLRAAGVPVQQHLQPGTIHGYLNRPEESDRARSDAQATIDTIVRELRAILDA